jgi:hypothetical protein
VYYVKVKDDIREKEKAAIKRSQTVMAGYTNNSQSSGLTLFGGNNNQLANTPVNSMLQ